MTIVDHSQRAHGLISASKYKRVEECPGSVTVFGHLKDRESVYAAEGTEAHEALDHFLRTNEWPDSIDDTTRIALEYVVDWVRRSGEGGSVFSEVAMCHPQASWVTGTSDIIIQFPDKLIVFDLKWGAGVEVTAQENTQLAFYANLCDPHGYYDGRTLFVICQPRMGWFKAWTPSAEWSRAFRFRLVTTIQRVAGGDTTLKESDEGCRWCPAQLVCPLKVGLLSEVESMSHVDVMGLSDDELVALFERVERLSGFISKVKAEAIARANVGRLPGYTLERGEGNRAWAYDESDTVARLAAVGLPADQVYKQSLISPAEAEQRLGPGGKGKIATLVTRPPSGTSKLKKTGQPGTGFDSFFS